LHIKRPTHWQLDSVPLRAMPASDVIAAFKKFDKNGDGVISKSELVDVLKALNSDSWDDASTNQLMSKADKNGDGVLQIDEFVGWLFAAMEKDSSVAEKSKFVAKGPEEKGSMIGQLFAFFDVDSDRCWNFQEAAACNFATEGKKLEPSDWQQMLEIAPPDMVNKHEGKITLEGMTWFYTNPDFSDSFCIEKDYYTVWTKIDMAQEVFDFFDQDQDTFWCFDESLQCSKVTDDNAGESHTEEAFQWLLNEVTPAGEDKTKGLSRKTICYCYCHPMYAKLGLNVAKDHERMRAHKAKLAGDIFEKFDADKDGFWSFEESMECSKATGGETDTTEAMYLECVAVMQPDGDKTKLSKESVVKMYVEPKFECKVVKDHAIAIGGEKLKMPAVGEK